MTACLNEIGHLKTVEVEIFALYVFTRNSRLLNISENMYTMKITILLA